MAGTIAISCPKCEKQINAPASVAGKKIRCKECRHVFTVKAPPAAKARPGKPAKEDEAVPVAAAAEEEEEEGSNPYGVTDMEFLPRCPFCAKQMEDEDAVICLNCGYNTQTRERVGTKKTHETTGGDTFLWLLPGILCALGLLWMLGNIASLWLLMPVMREEWEWGRGLTLFTCIWGSIISAGIGYLFAKFAVKRLIMNPTPPEVEKKK
jgi:hypothetical protein